MDTNILADLTDRQWEIVKQVVLRTPIKEIAHKLGLAPSTVNDHLAAAKRKLGVATTRELATLVIEGQCVGELDDIAPPQIAGGTKNRIGETSDSVDWECKDEPVFSFHESAALGVNADWYVRGAGAVPEALDGDDATLARLFAIAKMLALLLASIILAGASLVAIQMAIDSYSPTSVTDRSPVEQGDSSEPDT
jgi:DNA-binding CsgD family transcriptional regulator